MVASFSENEFQPRREAMRKLTKLAVGVTLVWFANLPLIAGAQTINIIAQGKVYLSPQDHKWHVKNQSNVLSIVDSQHTIAGRYVLTFQASSPSIIGSAPQVITTSEGIVLGNPVLESNAYVKVITVAGTSMTVTIDTETPIRVGNDIGHTGEDCNFYFFVVVGPADGGGYDGPINHQ
jgi:hypothetical protein